MLFLGVRLSAEHSIKLFKSFGFEVWATLPNIATLDGVERSLNIFGKRVA